MEGDASAPIWKRWCRQCRRYSLSVCKLFPYGEIDVRFLAVLLFKGMTGYGALRIKYEGPVPALNSPFRIGLGCATTCLS